MSNLAEMFSYGFMVRALVVGVMIAISAALVGVPLVLRRNAMIGDGLSHVAFAAFALATVMGLAPLYVSLPIVIVASMFILRLNDNAKINGDAAIALISTSALAIGTFFVSLFGTNIDINGYLFGSILTLGTVDVVAGVLLSLAVLVVFGLAYHKIFAISFDEKFARAIGIKTKRYNILFAGLCSVVIVLGMRLMGALLISSLIVFPVLTAGRIIKNYRGVVIGSVMVAVATFVIGLVLSYALGTPTGATIVIVNLITFIVATVVGVRG